MAKANTASNTLAQEMMRGSIYKSSQGKIARQVTAAVIGVTVLLGAWRLNQGAVVSGNIWLSVILPSVLAIVGVWFAFRIVNYTPFADFLIAVEAEMNKVSWPSRQELIRSSVVVIFLIFFLAALLYMYDVFWVFLFGKNGLQIIG